MTAVAPPTWLPVEPANIPIELAGDPSWYPAVIKPKAGKPGVWEKIPADPLTSKPARWSDPSTRCTFDAAYMAYQDDRRFDGIEYMLHDGAGVIGVDLST